MGEQRAKRLAAQGTIWYKMEQRRASLQKAAKRIALPSIILFGSYAASPQPLKHFTCVLGILGLFGLLLIMFLMGTVSLLESCQTIQAWRNQGLFTTCGSLAFHVLFGGGMFAFAVLLIAVYGSHEPNPFHTRPKILAYTP